MSCLKCGSTLPEGSVLCAKCGSPVRDDPAAQKVNETSAMYSTASVAYPGIMRTSTRLRVDLVAALRWLRSFWPLVLESLLVIAFGSIAATDWPPFSERTFWVPPGASSRNQRGCHPGERSRCHRSGRACAVLLWDRRRHAICMNRTCCSTLRVSPSRGNER